MRKYDGRTVPCLARQQSCFFHHDTQQLVHFTAPHFPLCFMSRHQRRPVWPLLMPYCLLLPLLLVMLLPTIGRRGDSHRSCLALAQSTTTIPTSSNASSANSTTNSTSAASSMANATNVTTTGLPMLRNVTRRGRNTTMTRTLVAKVPASTQRRNRTKSLTLTILPPPTTTAAPNTTLPPPAIDDLTRTANFDFVGAMLMKTPIAQFDPIAFMQNLRPALPLDSLYSKLFIVDYCGVPEPANQDDKSWSRATCVGLGNVAYNLTVVRFGFQGAVGNTNLSGIVLDKVVGIYEWKGQTSSVRAFEILPYTVRAGTPSPGVAARAAEAALTPIGGLLIFLFLVIIIVLVYAAVWYYNKRKRMGTAIDSSARGIGGSVPEVGDVYAAPASPAPGSATTVPPAPGSATTSRASAYEMQPTPSTRASTLAAVPRPAPATPSAATAKPTA